VQGLTKYLLENKESIKSVLEALTQLAVWWVQWLAWIWIFLAEMWTSLYKFWQVVWVLAWWIPSYFSLAWEEVKMDTEEAILKIIAVHKAMWSAIWETFAQMWWYIRDSLYSSINSIKENLNTVIEVINSITWVQVIEPFAIENLKEAKFSFEAIWQAYNDSLTKSSEANAKSLEDNKAIIAIKEQELKTMSQIAQHQLNEITYWEEAVAYIEKAKAVRDEYNKLQEEANLELAKTWVISNETVLKLWEMWDKLTEINEDWLDNMSWKYSKIAWEVSEVNGQFTGLKKDTWEVLKTMLDSNKVQVFWNAIAWMWELEKSILATQKAWGQLTQEQVAQFKQLEKEYLWAWSTIKNYWLWEILWDDYKRIWESFENIKSNFESLPQAVAKTGIVSQAIGEVATKTQVAEQQVWASTQNMKIYFWKVDTVKARAEVQNLITKTKELWTTWSNAQAWWLHLAQNFASWLSRWQGLVWSAIGSIINTITQLKHTEPDHWPLKWDSQWMLHFMQNLQGGLKRWMPWFEKEIFWVIETMLEINTKMQELNKEYEDFTRESNKEVAQAYVTLTDDIKKTKEDLVKAQKDKDTESIANLQNTLIQQETALQTFAWKEAQYQEEINEIRRRAGLTDFERTLEDNAKKEEEFRKSQETQALDLHNSLQKQLAIIKENSWEEMYASFTEQLNKIPVEARGSFIEASVVYQDFVKKAKSELADLESDHSEKIKDIRKNWDELKEKLAELEDSYKKSWESAKRELAKSVLWQINKVNDLSMEIGNMRVKAQQELASMSASFNKDMSNIQASIEGTRKKMIELDQSYARGTQKEEMGLAEQVVKQQEKVAKLQEEIASKKAGWENTSTLEAELTQEQIALQKSASLQIWIEEEIAEVKRRNSLTDFERFIEDYNIRQQTRAQEYNENKAKLDQEILDLQNSEMLKREVFRISYEEKRLQQEMELMDKQLILDRELEMQTQATEYAKQLELDLDTAKTEMQLTDWERTLADYEAKQEQRDIDFEKEKEGLLLKQEELKKSAMQEISIYTVVKDKIKEKMWEARQDYMDGLKQMQSWTQAAWERMISIFKWVASSIRDMIWAAQQAAEFWIAINVWGMISQRAWARANWWPVEWWSSYLVGERWPEIFTPRISWNITPNNKIGWIVLNFTWTFGHWVADELWDMIMQKLKYHYSI
jgi:hypothetical protein